MTIPGPGAGEPAPRHRSWQPPGGPGGGGGGPFGPAGGYGPPGWQRQTRGGAPAPRRGRAAGIAPWLRQNAVFAAVMAGLLGVLVFGIVRRHLLGWDDLILFGCLVPAIILHEVAHGVVALWCGDDTAKRARRLTLNPLRHVDPIGSIVLPIFLLFTLHSTFGWAKPVPVNVNRLRHPRNQAVLVGLAGPATNIVLSAAAGLAYHLFYLQANPAALGPEIVAGIGLINLYVAGFNLLPIPPLDGSALIERLLPARLLPQYYRIRPFFLVVVLIGVFVLRTGLEDLFNWLAQLWVDAVTA